MDWGRVTDFDCDLPQEVTEFILSSSTYEGLRHSSPNYDTEATPRPSSSGTANEKRRSLFEDSDGEEDVDFNGWRNMRPEVWETRDTKNWLVSAAEKLGQAYRDISPELAMPGRNLLLLSRRNFLSYDRRFGGKLYDLLHGKRGSKGSLESPDHRPSQQDSGSGSQSADGRLAGQSCYPSGSSNGIKRRTTKRKNARQKIKIGAPKIWEFVRGLLFDPRFCPKSIRWENYSEKRFRFVKNREIAKLWGARRGNENMNFEKFSRALRYHYKTNILEPVPDCSLVYKFGPKAEGLETDNPNFGFEHQ